MHGHLIETNSFEPGWNNFKNLQLSTNNKSLDHISTVISSQIQVNVIAAGAALAKLAESPTMAIAMGSLGQQRVRHHYDWTVILKRYADMLDNLKFRREKAISQAKQNNLKHMTPMPLLADIFSEWPSNITNLNAIIEAQGHIIDLQRYLNLKIITMYQGQLPSKLLIVSTFKLLSKNIQQ